jgi:hypothetical protein
MVRDGSHVHEIWTSLPPPRDVHISRTWLSKKVRNSNVVVFLLAKYMVFYRASLAVLIQWPPPPDNPQKCEMLYLNNGWSVSLTDLGSTLAMICCHAPETVCDVVQRFSLSGHPLLITLKNAKCSIARTWG